MSAVEYYQADAGENSLNGYCRGNLVFSKGKCRMQEDNAFSINVSSNERKDNDKIQEKLWTRGFFILWQGQLVSTLGDAAYSVALGFWVLQVTGSTALMGTLMAASTLPGVIISPFAGVLVDRTNRKRLLILMDFLRGLCVCLVAVAAFNRLIAVWMVFAAGIILSICGAAFRPGISASIPDLVPKSKLLNANSVFQIVSNGANMLGNIAGGFLFQLLGASFMFLFNGLSYLFSGVSISFVKMPSVKRETKLDFFKDMGDGFRFIWRFKGLRAAMILSAFDNFLSFIAIVLILPLFERTPYLGPARYGIIMACFMGGMMGGYLLTSFIKIPHTKNLFVFMSAFIVSSVCFIIGVNLRIFSAMVVLIAAGGFLNSILNVILQTSVQRATPQEVRGKVMAFLSMISQGLTPISMALGGVLAEFFPIRGIMNVSFSLAVLAVTPFAFVRPFRQYLNFDYDHHDVCELIDN